MEVKENVIYFKSNPMWFIKEKSGNKSNTVRLLDYKEMFYLQEWLRTDDTKFIEIECYPPVFEDKSFRRKLTDVSFIGNIIDKHIVVFSWKHEED